MCKKEAQPKIHKNFVQLESIEPFKSMKANWTHVTRRRFLLGKSVTKVPRKSM